MCITICGRFRLNEGGVAGYGNRMKAKYTANWGVQIVGMIFQTRSNLNTPYTQKTEESYPYICDIRARIECEPLSEHSTHSDTFTNIRIGFFGFRLSVVYL